METSDHPEGDGDEARLSQTQPTLPLSPLKVQIKGVTKRRDPNTGRQV